MKALQLVFLSLTCSVFICKTSAQSFIAGQVNSNITYIDFADDTLIIPTYPQIITRDTVKLDFDSDGIHDISIKGYSAAVSSSLVRYNSITIQFANRLGFFHTHKDSLLFFNDWVTDEGVFPYEMNDTIADDRDSSIGSYIILDNIIPTKPLNYFYSWIAQGDRYIGAFFFKNNQKYKIWIRGELSLANQNVSFIIKDAAYESFLTNISRESEPPQIQIFPNPANEYLIIDGLRKNNHPIQIFDVIGNVVLESSGNQNRIDISKLLSGIYFLKIKTKDSFEIKKIIKE